VLSKCKGGDVGKRGYPRRRTEGTNEQPFLFQLRVHRTWLREIVVKPETDWFSGMEAGRTGLRDGG